MIQTNSSLRRQESLNSEYKKKLLLKKSKTVEQAMMEDFLTRQKIYDKVNQPIIKLEQLKFNPPKIEISKLGSSVREARQRFKEFTQKRKEVQSNALQKEKITREVQEMRKQKEIKIPKQNNIQVVLIICVVLLYVTIQQII